MTSTRSIRDLVEADLDWVAEQEKAIFGASAWSRSVLAEDFRVPGNRYLGVEADGALVGYGITAYDGDALHVLNLAVVVAQRGRGIGRFLLDAMLGQARELGAAEVWLEVRIDNDAARRLYESRGFEGVRVRRRYYQPEDVDGLVMRLRLPAGG